MKKFFLALAAVFCIISSSAQQVSFEIQAGLSSAIRKVVTLEEGRVVAVATSDGDLILWDVPGNKISSRLGLNAEIYDMIFLQEPKMLAVATPGEVKFYSYDDRQLTYSSQHPCDNPTAVWTDHTSLWVATAKEVLEMDISRSRTEVVGRTAVRRTTPYTIRIFDDKIFLAGNGGAGIYKISGNMTAESDGPDTSAIEPVSLDTSSSVENDEEEAAAIAELREFNTGWYAHYWNESGRELFVSRESELRIFQWAGNLLRSRQLRIPGLSTGNITGICRVGDKLWVGTSEGLLFKLSYPLKQGEVPVPVKMENGSLTHLAKFSELLIAGDFYGNVTAYDPGSLDKVIAMNDESTPALTGVYLDGEKRMVTTHKDPAGAQVRVWDLLSAKLSNVIRFPAQQVISLAILGDTIETYHADLSVYRVTLRAAGYDTINLQRPLSPYVPGFEIELPESDPMLVIERDRMHLREAASVPGAYHWLDTLSGYKVLYTVPPSIGCETMPPYAVLEMYYRSTGLLEYMHDWDVADQDMFFMKACRYTEEQFLNSTANGPIPKEKRLAFFHAIRNPSKSNIRVFDEKSRDTLFVISQTGLQYLRYHPDQGSWVLFYDTTAYIYQVRGRKLEKININLPPGFFHYSLGSTALAITSVNKTVVYDRKQHINSTTWLSFGHQDFLVHNQDGYYRTRGRSDRLVAYESGIEKPLAYFDLRYNRPDLVVSQLAGEQAPQTRVLAKAIEKRIQRLKGKLPVWSGNDEEPDHSAFSLLNTAGYLQLPSQKTPGISVKGWINGVLLKPGMAAGTPIELNPGLNKLELRFTNRTGDTVYGVQEQYVYSAVTRPQRWHFFGGGIDHYKDSSLNLRYAVKDIKDLAAAFTSVKRDMAIDTRENQELELAGWKDWKQKLASTNANDVVIISLSGHGYLDSLGNFYLASHHSTSDRFLPAASYDEILDLMDAAPARKRILFLDACHSGVLDNETDLTDLPDSVKVRSFSKKKQANTGTLSFRVMQDEFLDLARHNGTIVIAAAAGSEFAMESSDRRNGLFTYVLQKALFEHKADLDRDGRINTSELREYLGREVELLSGGGQKPTTNQDNQGLEWNIVEY